MIFATALFPGIVRHERLRPRAHRLKYGVFMMLFDLDELSDLNRRLRLFGWNKGALISFFDKDHGDRTGAPLRPWVERQLKRAGIEPDGGPIRILAMPRVLNHVFNPISVWFCHARSGALVAMVYEVNNTFGESHSYVIPAEPGADGSVEQACAKALYVSPFMDMDLDYAFRIRPPEAKTSVAILVKDAQGPMLTASFAGDRRELSDAALFRTWLAHPLLSLKVLAGIHWEALFIWLKGVGFRTNPKFAKPPAVAPAQRNA